MAFDKDLITHDDPVDELMALYRCIASLRADIDAIQNELTNTRRGLFSRYNEVMKACMSHSEDIAMLKDQGSKIVQFPIEEKTGSGVIFPSEHSKNSFFFNQER